MPSFAPNIMTDNVHEYSVFQYSKSSKAPCHGLPPCKGTPIELGVLRYGEVAFGEYGETVRWRHWCALTILVLQELS